MTSTLKTPITARSAGSPPTTVYAMSCLRANPLTGEMIDGDVVFDASFIRYWKQEYALLVGSTTAHDGKPQTAPLAIGEVISPILASKMGYGQPNARSLARDRRAREKPQSDDPEVVPADQNFLSWQLAKNLARGSRGFCQYQSGLQRDFGLAAIAMADAVRRPPSRQTRRNDKER